MTAFAQFMNEQTSIPNFAEALQRAFNPYEDVSLRVPFYMTSSWREKLGIRGVAMKMNPSSVSFRSAKRISERKTRGGSTFFHWTDRLGRDNDLTIVEFAGQTGNINIATGAYMKGGWVQNAANYVNKGVDWLNEKLAQASNANDPNATGLEPLEVAKNLAGASKLANFMNLWQLTREPVVDVRDGTPVYHYIQYGSTLFADTRITLVGHFNEALQVTDDANDPFNKKYSFSFTVHGSHPSMDYIYTAVLQNLSQHFTNDLS